MSVFTFVLANVNKFKRKVTERDEKEAPDVCPGTGRGMRHGGLRHGDRRDRSD